MLRGVEGVGMFLQYWSFRTYVSIGHTRLGNGNFTDWAIALPLALPGWGGSLQGEASSPLEKTPQPGKRGGGAAQSGK